MMSFNPFISTGHIKKDEIIKVRRGGTLTLELSDFNTYVNVSQTDEGYSYMCRGRINLTDVLPNYLFEKNAANFRPVQTTRVVGDDGNFLLDRTTTNTTQTEFVWKYNSRSFAHIVWN